MYIYQESKEKSFVPPKCELMSTKIILFWLLSQEPVISINNQIRMLYMKTDHLSVARLHV